MRKSEGKTILIDNEFDVLVAGNWQFARCEGLYCGLTHSLLSTCDTARRVSKQGCLALSPIANIAVSTRGNSSVTKNLLERPFRSIIISLDGTLAVVAGVCSGAVLEACLVDIWTMMTCLATSEQPHCLA